MCILKNFFAKQEIEKVWIIGEIEGITEEDQLMNTTVGHMMGGFDGMMHANMLNEELAPETIFLIKYTNGTKTKLRVKTNSSLYYKLIQKL